MGFKASDPAIRQALERGLVVAVGGSTDLQGLLNAREALAALSAARKGPGEEAAAMVRGWCLAGGWPEPEAEYPFARPARRWRFDLAWPARLVAVEFQGGIYTNGRHTRRGGFAGDCEKFSEAAARGWRVLPVTYPQAKNGMLKDWLARIFAEGKR